MGCLHGAQALALLSNQVLTCQEVAVATKYTRRFLVWVLLQRLGFPGHNSIPGLSPPPVKCFLAAMYEACHGLLSFTTVS